ncbi:sugar transferase [Altererythrobacter arenosus]|uniref:Sugar transferase n=1 Tax=Altererythrobacter arenosus TaxID=3032592 RepID=A0ABY8FU08_9SPHN|nr:sugar transferase [Altererythrobacter sp. CAU 1644]WFL78494.1 sugar transferase [Altererythrobacter sp. CAU 1644]
MNKPVADLTRAIRAHDTEIPVASSLEQRRLRLYAALLFGDGALLLLGFAIAGLAYEGAWLEPRAMKQGQLLMPLFYTIALYNRTYCAQALTDWRFAIGKAAVALMIGAGLLNFIAFYLKTNATFSRGSFTLGLVFTFILIAGSRLGVTWLVRSIWGGRVRNCLVIDDGGPEFSERDSDRVSTASMDIDPFRNDPQMLDRLGRLFAARDRVVVSCPHERRGQWALLLRSIGVHGEVVSASAYELGAVGVRRHEDQGVATLVVSVGKQGLRARTMKRVFDLAVAATGLVLLAPLLLVAALLIKLEDGGPVLFVQRRMGQGNRFFSMYKLRTMREDGRDAEGARSTREDDRRVTRIGRWLRRNSFDELPQLWNVIRGEMSIVGPRPHALGSRANDKLFWDIDTRYWKRHSLKPGLTGLAQVRGQRGSTWEEKDLTDRLQSDLEYIAAWSIWRDMLIAWRTLSVLRHERAY